MKMEDLKRFCQKRSLAWPVAFEQAYPGIFSLMVAQWEDAFEMELFFKRAQFPKLQGVSPEAEALAQKEYLGLKEIYRAWRKHRAPMAPAELLKANGSALGADADKGRISQQQEGVWRQAVLFATQDIAKCVGLLAAHGLDADARDSSDNTLLSYACQHGSANCALELLKAGANPNAKGQNGATPLICACKGGNLRLVEMLLYFGANPNGKDCYEQTAMHFAAMRNAEKMIIRLSDYGALADEKDGQGSTPLLYASAMGNLAAAWRLLTLGADPCKQNIMELSAMDAAKENEELGKLLALYLAESKALRAP